MNRSQVVDLPIGSLKPRSRNARTHSRKQIRKIADSITRFGFVTPVLIDGQRSIIAGHGRVEAAKLSGLALVPTLTVDHLSPAEVRAYVIADNKLASLAGWDRELLAIEVAELVQVAPEIDLTVTGFELEEIQLLQDVAGSKKTAEAEAPLPELERSSPAVTELRDLWLIGPHRLLCADALDRASYAALLGRERADLVIADPPYNVPIQGHVSGLGSTRHREFAMASGEMSRAEFQRFLVTICGHLARFSQSGSLHYIFMDWRSIGDLLSAGEAHYEALLNVIVWVKPNGGMGALYRSRHEMVALFKRGRRQHKNNVELGANGRYRTNVWEYAGANSFGPERDQNLATHPTVKNLDMITEAIRDASNPEDIVLDPFGGSGTTLIAAEHARRKARLIELDPHYCDLIARRAVDAGLQVALAQTGEPFDQTARSRAAQRSSPRILPEEMPANG